MTQQQNNTIDKVITDIVVLNDEIRSFWSQANGWAPSNTADLLNISKLDWQVSLSKCLKIWLEKRDDDDSGSLILAWANLGSLVEGTLKLVLCVFYDEYQNDNQAVYGKNGTKLIKPDVLEFDKLRQFFVKKQIIDQSLDIWILHIQQRRNAIHAYKNRDIGNWNEFYLDVKNYYEFLQLMNNRLPYP